jgi:predicted esterase
MKRAALFAMLAVVIAMPTAGRASPGSLPFVWSGPRPGPDVLYAPLADAPQLENSNGWEADPIMVSGADAYARGEYLYQDYIYDSYGANTSNVLADQPDTVPASTATLFGGATGDVVYPTNAKKYGFDAADLLEFRARETPAGVGYRITLNTMLDPSVAAVAIGVDADRDASTGAADWGYGVGSLGKLGLEHVVAVFGADAIADGGAPFHASVDDARNQIDVQTSLQTGGATWRHYLVVGLANGLTFRTILEQPTADDPGGAHNSNPPPVFNAGFRFDEPMSSQYLSDPTSVATLADLGARTSGNGNWREHGQAKALAARDISAYHADIDFSKLAARAYESHVPRHGWINRLYASHLDLGEGAQASRPMLLGKIQPYGVYVPNSYDGSPAPFHLLMHSLSCSYNQYAVFTPNQLRQIGDDRGAFLMTPEGRGPDGWYHDAAEVDLFEAWADLAHRYRLDSNRTTVGGYSMGGYGTFKTASQYPDLFARGFAVVGPADEAIQGGPTGGLSEDKQNTFNIADNLRNVPLLMWEGTNDELVPLAGTLQYEKRLADLGYRHQQWLFAGYDHFLESINDQWAEARDWLGADVVNREPEQVVYRAMPEMDNAAMGLVHDHAYWVDDIRVAGSARSALVDARAERTAAGKPVPYDTAGAGVRALPYGGAYVQKGTDWRATAQLPSNTLTLRLTDTGSATLWLTRTNLDLGDPITVVADANVPSTITLKRGYFGTVTLSIPAGHSTFTV